MSEENAVLLPDWPQPDSTNPSPIVTANDSGGTLAISYRTRDGKFAALNFPLCIIFTFGTPGVEELDCHPLYGRGLASHAVHRVENSAWITQLDGRKIRYPGHNQKRFLSESKHFIFTFNSLTLECVVSEWRMWPMAISLFDSEAEAITFLEKI